MTTHNAAAEAKRIARRYLKLDRWFEEDIGEIERAIDLIVQAASDKARHDIGKNQPPPRETPPPPLQIHTFARVPHPMRLSDRVPAHYGNCTICGAPEEHQIHATPAIALPPSVKIGEKVYYRDTEEMQAIREAARHVCKRWNQVEQGSPLDHAIRGLRKALGLPEMP